MTQGHYQRGIKSRDHDSTLNRDLGQISTLNRDPGHNSTWNYDPGHYSTLNCDPNPGSQFNVGKFCRIHLS